LELITTELMTLGLRINNCQVTIDYIKNINNTKIDESVIINMLKGKLPECEEMIMWRITSLSSELITTIKSKLMTTNSKKFKLVTSDRRGFDLITTELMTLDTSRLRINNCQVTIYYKKDINDTEGDERVIINMLKGKLPECEKVSMFGITSLSSKVMTTIKSKLMTTSFKNFKLSTSDRRGFDMITTELMTLDTSRLRINKCQVTIFYLKDIKDTKFDERVIINMLKGKLPELIPKYIDVTNFTMDEIIETISTSKARKLELISHDKSQYEQLQQQIMNFPTSNLRNEVCKVLVDFIKDGLILEATVVHLKNQEDPIFEEIEIDELESLPNELVVEIVEKIQKLKSKKFEILTSDQRGYDELCRQLMTFNTSNITQQLQITEINVRLINDFRTQYYNPIEVKVFDLFSGSLPTCEKATIRRHEFLSSEKIEEILIEIPNIKKLHLFTTHKEGFDELCSILKGFDTDLNVDRCDIEVRLLPDMNVGYYPTERFDVRLYNGKSPDVTIF